MWRAAGFSFSGCPTVVLERPAPAAGWIVSFSGTTVVLERPLPAGGWIFVSGSSSTGTAGAGGWLDFRSLVLQV